MAKIGEIYNLVLKVKVFRLFEDGTADVCDGDGNCFKVPQQDLLIKIDTNNMKQMNDACLSVAKDLALANNTFTTLEVKLQARRDYPYFYWTQDVVSKLMDGFAGDGLFTYTDNGTYRTYSAVGKVASAALTKTVKASPAITVTNPQAPAKNKRVNWSQVLGLAGNPKFEAVTLVNGTTVNRAAIKGQKKSPLGYISPKQGRIASIVVDGKSYDVK